MVSLSLYTTKKLLFVSEYFNAPFLQPHIWKYNVVFSSGVDGLLSNRVKEMGLQRNQTELWHFPSSGKADLCTFSLKCTVQNFAILSWTHVLEASRLACEELGDLQSWTLEELPALPGHTDTLGAPLQSPGNAVPNLRDLELWPADNSRYKSTLGCFTACSFLIISSRTLVFAMCLGGKAQCDTATASPCHAEEPVPHQAVSVNRWACCFSYWCLILWSWQPDIYIYWIICIITQLPPPLQPPQVHLMLWEQDTIRKKKKKKRMEITVSDTVLWFQNCEGEKIYCSIPWKDRSYQKTLTTTTALFMNKNLVLLVLLIYTAVTPRCKTQRKVSDAEHISKQSQGNSCLTWDDRKQITWSAKERRSSKIIKSTQESKRQNTCLAII